MQLLILQLVDLISPNPGDKAQVVITSTNLVALDPPVADFAMWNGARIRFGCRDDGCLKMLLHESVVGKKVVDAEMLNFEWLTGFYDRHPLGRFSLHRPNDFRVERKLKDCPCFRRLGELCVGNFVRPRPKLAGHINLEQQIRVALPSVVLKLGLHDDVVALTHRLKRSLRSVLLIAVNFKHRLSLEFQMLQEVSFVLNPTLNQSFKQRIVPERLRQLVMSDLSTQLSQVLASKVIRQIRSGKDELFLFELHDVDQVVVSRRAIRRRRRRRRISKSGDCHHTDGWLLHQVGVHQVR